MARQMSLEQFERWLQRFPADVAPAVLEGLQEAGLQASALVVEQIDAMGLTDTGGLRQSVNTRNIPDGIEIRVDAPYAAVVEYGRRPGARMPPIEPIRLWAVRKLGMDPDDAAEAAFGIALSIAIAGTEPKRFFAKALGNLKPIVQAAIRRALKRYRP